MGVQGCDHEFELTAGDYDSVGGTQMVKWYEETCKKCGAVHSYSEEDGAITCDMT